MFASDRSVIATYRLFDNSSHIFNYSIEASNASDVAENRLQFTYPLQKSTTVPMLEVPNEIKSIFAVSNSSKVVLQLGEMVLVYSVQDFGWKLQKNISLPLDHCDWVTFDNISDVSYSFCTPETAVFVVPIQHEQSEYSSKIHNPFPLPFREIERSFAYNSFLFVFALSSLSLEYTNNFQGAFKTLYIFYFTDLSAPSLFYVLPFYQEEFHLDLSVFSSQNSSKTVFHLVLLDNTKGICYFKMIFGSNSNLKLTQMTVYGFLGFRDKFNSLNCLKPSQKKAIATCLMGKYEAGGVEVSLFSDGKTEIVRNYTGLPGWHSTGQVDWIENKGFMMEIKFNFDSDFKENTFLVFYNSSLGVILGGLTFQEGSSRFPSHSEKTRCCCW